MRPEGPLPGARKARIPVPAPPTIRTTAKVLRQAPEIVGAGPVGAIGRDRVGRLVERGEPIRVGRHEPDDALDAGPLHLWCDVDEDKPAAQRRPGVPFGDQSRHPAERSTDEGGNTIEVVDHRLHVAGECVDPIVAIGGPIAVAVPAEIHGDSAASRLRQARGDGGPRVSGLAAAVQQHHQGTVLWPDRRSP